MSLELPPSRDHYGRQFTRKRLQLLRRPDPAPSLNEFWEPPPTFSQRKIAQNDFEPGINARWQVDLCYYKHRRSLFPSLTAYAVANVRHANLVVGEGMPGFVRITVPLVWISYIELVSQWNNRPRGIDRGATRVDNLRRPRGAFTGQLEIQGWGIFRMRMYLSAKTNGELYAIRDWLRFLVVRQRIPHLVMGLEFEWTMQWRKHREKELAKKQKKNDNKCCCCFDLAFFWNLIDKLRL